MKENSYSLLLKCLFSSLPFVLLILLCSCVGHERTVHKNGEQTTMTKSEGLGTLFLKHHLNNKK